MDGACGAVTISVTIFEDNSENSGCFLSNLSIVSSDVISFGDFFPVNRYSRCIGSALSKPISLAGKLDFVFAAQTRINSPTPVPSIRLWCTQTHRIRPPSIVEQLAPKAGTAASGLDGGRTP